MFCDVYQLDEERKIIFYHLNVKNVIFQINIDQKDNIKGIKEYIYNNLELFPKSNNRSVYYLKKIEDNNFNNFNNRKIK